MNQQAVGFDVSVASGDDPIARFLTTLRARYQLAEPALDRAARVAAESHVRIDRVLHHLGLAGEDTIVDTWSAVTGLAIVGDGEIDRDTVEHLGISRSFLAHTRCFPCSNEPDRIRLAVEDPLDAFAPAALAAKLGRPVERVLIRTSLLEALLQPSDGQAPTDGQRNFAATDEGIGHDLDRLRDLASDEPVIRFVNAMIDRAVDLRASDIHVTRTSHGSRLRYRIDGVLRDMEPPPAGMHAAVISRVKIMSGLDIAERRLPQDGRTRVSFRGRELDLRVATMPHAHGEGVVLRLLDRTAVPLDLRTLGLSPHVVTPLSAALERPNGIVLVTGPTGSGKSTTLYAALRTIQGPSKNIVTVEDPIEHYLDGISQIQVSRQIGFDFANVLRAILRQDPDVIMIGEIRDRETAIVAVQAALTGHLVLATVHTNSAAGALPRLVDMGVEPFLLASCLRGVLSQRLVRTLCPQCRQPAAFRADDPMAAPGSIADAFEARGCAHCAQTGFKGRSAIAEFLPAADEIRDALLRGADAATIDAAGRRHGLIPLIEDGRDKVREGVTTTAELLRVSGDDGG